jgi:transposase
MARGVLSPIAAVLRYRGIGACAVMRHERNVVAAGAPTDQTVAADRGRQRVYLGVDIGKHAHYAVAVDTGGTRVLQRGVDNDEAALRELVVWAQTEQASIVVDQPGGTAAVLLALATASDVPIGYLHGSAMARARGFYSGEGKSDPKDAFVLADCGRAHPDRIAWLAPTSEQRAELALLCAHDEDLGADANRLTNRLRDLLATHWPLLERSFGDRLDTGPVLGLLGAVPSGELLAHAGVRQIAERLKANGGRNVAAYASRIHTAAQGQTVVVPGATMAARLVAEIAEQLRLVLSRRDALAREIEQAFFTLPEALILTSLPGVGPRLGARIAVEVGDIRRFRSAAQLAAYAGLGPTPHQSGRVLQRNVTRRHGNHRLKNAFFLAAFASLRHPPSRTYYDRKRAAGKGHTQAISCLARRRVDVLHAMLTTATLYRQPSTTPSTIAA